MPEPADQHRWISSAISLLFIIVAFAGIAVAIIGAVLFFPGTNGQPVP